jgi:hypothetical protein
MPEIRASVSREAHGFGVLFRRLNMTGEWLARHQGTLPPSPNGDESGSCHSSASRLLRLARAASSIRLVVPVFLRRFDTWVLTVFSLMNSWRPICA